MAAEEKASHNLIMRGFGEYVKDAELYLVRAKDLKERIQSTVTLVRFQHIQEYDFEN